MSPADAAQVRHRPPSPYSKDEDQVRNWSKYEAGLRRRAGTLAELSRRQAGALTDAATQTSPILHSAFKLLSRQAEGLMDAVLTLMGLTISAAHRQPPGGDVADAPGNTNTTWCVARADR
jgi:hypothetical protein